MKTRTLVIVNDRFDSKVKTSYLELVYDSNEMSTEEIELERRPRQARFDEVLENGEGEHNMWNAHRAKRLYGHKLEKPKKESTCQ